MNRILTILFIIACFVLRSQEIRQVVRGNISRVSGEPVGQATVILNGAVSYTSQADSAGQYLISVLPGKYTEVVQAPGHKIVSRNNVVVISGKQQVQDFALEDLGADLETIVISGDRNPGSVGLDLWNIQQFAAVFYDPGRVVNSHAGTANADDGTNHMTVRGTSPDYIQWKLEGVEIVNPNHLENAGTVNDRPAFNGGGVSLISAQLLQNSEFHFAPFDAMQGNALSGIFDMKLRNGNDHKREHIVQVSLLGTDLAIEGPFSKSSRSSYLLNFRYSTIGLLSKLGVNFGDEQTEFADFSHSLNFPFKRGSVRIFGMSGLSETRFRGKLDTGLLEIQKELQNIDYRSLTSINGISFLSGIGSSAYIKTVAAYSIKNVRRSARPTALLFLPVAHEQDNFRQEKISTVTYLGHSLGRSMRAKVGFYLNYFSNSVKSMVDTIARLNGSASQPLVQPFVSVDGEIGTRVNFSIGIHNFWLPEKEHLLVQPRLLLGYQINSNQSITFRSGSSAQLPSAFLQVNSRDQLLPTTNEALSLMHVYRHRNLKLSTEIYLQRFRKIPEQETFDFSAFNYFNEMVFFTLNQQGSAEVYGLDLMFEKHFTQFYLITSASIYNSTYSAPWTNIRKGRFNTGYNTFFTAGKEFSLRNKPHFLSADLRVMYRDGFRDLHDVSGTDYTYDAVLENYWRMDLRLSYKKNKATSTVIWALDIQNLANRRNEAYHYFDRVSGKIETKYQLGLIPVLSYKVMF
jgi:hypothetical protein